MALYPYRDNLGGGVGERPTPDQHFYFLFQGSRTLALRQIFPNGLQATELPIAVSGSNIETLGLRLADNPDPKFVIV
ncbi:MAG: hypothetical protein ACU0DD_15915 [Paracoccus sp. (in: a-proteobacteria)]|uniref:hypothetical protein n=1 Tax=Paracoccus sp. TaxID=267 RepID=UPI00405952C8